MGTSACLFHLWEVSSRGALCAFVRLSVPVVGVRVGCEIDVL